MQIDLRNDEEVKQKLLYFAGRLSNELKNILRQTALMQKQTILDRTSDGEDFEGIDFEPYSSYWSFVRYVGIKVGRKRGKKGKWVGGRKYGGGLPIDKVDLFFRGNMLGSMNVRNKGLFKEQIGFAGAEQQNKATGHNEGRGGLPQREFFGASLRDIDDIFYFVNGSVDDIIRASA